MTAKEWVEDIWGVDRVRAMSPEERKKLLRKLRFVEIHPTYDVTENPDGTKTFTITGSMNDEIHDFVMGLVQ